MVYNITYLMLKAKCYCFWSQFSRRTESNNSFKGKYHVAKWNI